MNELAGDVVKMHKKVEESFSFATLKAEHDRMKKIIRKKLQVDV